LGEKRTLQECEVSSDIPESEWLESAGAVNVHRTDTSAPHSDETASANGMPESMRRFNALISWEHANPEPRASRRHPHLMKASSTNLAGQPAQPDGNQE
jgi:hypothetical protein